MKNLFSKNKAGSKKGGFTLIEMVVAVTLLAGATLGPIVVAVRAIDAATQAKNRNLANYLALEVVEVLKNRQATNFLNNAFFSNGIKGDTAGSSACVLDLTASPVLNGTCRVDTWGGPQVIDGVSLNGMVTSCAGDTCKLKTTTSGGETRYNHTGSVDAPNNLRRWFQVEVVRNGGVVDPDQLRIIVTVAWTEKGVDRSVVVSDYIQNWGQ